MMLCRQHIPADHCRAPAACTITFFLLHPQPEVLERIAADPFTFAAPGGESQQELEARLCSFVHRQLLPSLQWGGPPAVVVTHGLAIKWWVVTPKVFE
jgi:broad specificity phosphatase PhoE